MKRIGLYYGIQKHYLNDQLSAISRTIKLLNIALKMIATPDKRFKNILTRVAEGKQKIKILLKSHRYGKLEYYQKPKTINKTSFSLVD